MRDDILTLVSSFETHAATSVDLSPLAAEVTKLVKFLSSEFERKDDDESLWIESTIEERDDRAESPSEERFRSLLDNLTPDALAM